jgi:lambda family phage minor tail protein L
VILNDIQKLEVGGRVFLYELDLSGIGGQVLRFHNYTQQGAIIWQGVAYEPWAIEASGFSRTGDAQQPSPTLSVGNIGDDGTGNPVVGVVSALCLLFDDLVGARFIRHQTLAKYLDAANFPDGNPSADPSEHLPDEIWLIEVKTRETPESIEFSLSSALDFQGQQLPNNKILANHCLALKKGGYRGYWCQYTGSNMFDLNDEPVTDPILDRCAGMVSSCKKRFGEYEVINFVGAPSADRLRGY